MWAQLALAGLQSLQDAQNKKNDIASNVITQKYSPWTGQNANFKSQGNSQGVNHLIAGYGAGMLQDNVDGDMDSAAKEHTMADAKSDAAFYTPGQVGTPMHSQSTFAQAPSSNVGRSPAVMPGGNGEVAPSSMPIKRGY
jgi:hypothetical protein